MITLKDIHPEVAGELTELIANFKEIGEEPEGQRIVDSILLDIEKAREEAALLYPEEEGE